MLLASSRRIMCCHLEDLEPNKMRCMGVRLCRKFYFELTNVRIYGQQYYLVVSQLRLFALDLKISLFTDLFTVHICLKYSLFTSHICTLCNLSPMTNSRKVNTPIMRKCSVFQWRLAKRSCKAAALPKKST